MTGQVRNGRVIYPAGSPVRLEDYGDLFGDDARVTPGTIIGVNDAEALKAVICACPIGNGAYHVLWVDEGDDASLFTDDEDQMLFAVEIAHGGLYLEIIDRGQGLEFGYKSAGLDSFESPEDMGITREVLEARPDTLEFGGMKYISASELSGKGRRPAYTLRSTSRLRFRRKTRQSSSPRLPGSYCFQSRHGISLHSAWWSTRS